MGCLIMTLLGFVTLLGPRLLLLVLYFADWTDGAFQTYIWPILGFLFLPFTTLAYAFTMFHNGGAVNGDFTWLIVIAVVLDVCGNTAIRTQSSD